MGETFEDAFDRMFIAAYRLAYRLLGDRAAAEDTAAEACARAYADWKRIGDLSYRDAWVLRVASNLAIDAMRRRPRHAERPHGEDMEDAVVLRIALVAALRSLPKRQRETVALRHLAGLSEAEVAELLGVSAGSVKMHLSRGLAAMRSKLGEGAEEAYLV